MNLKIKALTGLAATVAAVGLLSVSAYAATAFSFGEPTEGSGEVSLPVYLETTDHSCVGGCHFFVEYTDGYEYSGYEMNPSLSGGSVNADNSEEKRTGFVWYTGENQMVEGQKLLLGNVKFKSSKGAANALKDLALSPMEIIYIDGVADGSGGAMKIADLSGLATFITYDIMKEQKDWSHGVIERLYIADENENYADLDYVIESDDRYTVVIKLALSPDEEKVVKELRLFADTADEKGIMLNDFGSVVIENMNAKS